jgi:chromosome partitioning protein
MKIAVVKQKGGTGASALATTLAVELAKLGDSILVDLDPNQQTSVNHLKTRFNSEINPSIHNLHYKVINDGKKAVKASNDYNHTVFDGAATASLSTGIISQVSDLVLIPTGFSKDDLDPNITLAYELMDYGVDKRNIFIVFNNANGTYPEQREAIKYLKQTEVQFMQSVVKNRPCYRQALNAGKILTEVSFPGPKQKAKELIASILFFGGFDYE